MNRRQEATGGCGGQLLFVFIALLLVLWLTACTTTRIVEVERVRTDTCYINRYQRDSIYRCDSIYIKDRGDTVWIERWHTVDRDRLRTDTIYISRTDSVPVPYLVTEYVEKPLTWWQQTRINVANAVLFVFVIAAAFWIWRKKLGKP